MRTSPTFATRFIGHIDDELLVKAYSLLSENNPGLCAAIRENGNSYVLDSADRFDLRFIKAHEPLQSLIDEASRPMDHTMSLARLIRTGHGNSGYLALRVNHAIADARHIIALIHQLWSIYTDLVGGSDIARQRRSLPLAPEVLLEGAEIEFQAEAPQHVRELPSVTARSHTSRVRLSRTATKRVRARARANGVSVHSLISGAVIVALRRQNTVHGAMLMHCMSLVDLRRQLSFPVMSTDVTNLVGLHRAALFVPIDAASLDLGHQIGRQLQNDLMSRRIDLDVLGPIFIAPSTSPPHLGITMINNLGVIEPFRTPPGVHVTDFLVPPRQQTTLPYSNYFISTYAGMLAIEGTFYAGAFSRSQSESILFHVRDLVLSG